MKPWNRLLLPVVLAFALPGVLLGQPHSDPGVGTWVLNVAKSSFKPGPAPQSETRTYEATPDGIRLTVQQVGGNGTAITETSTYKLDGKPYALTGNPNIDALEITRVDARETRSNEMRNGKVIGHLTRIVSKDGKSLTITVTIRTVSGQTEHAVRVYDRQ